jgi:hypothetical protein
LSDSKQDILEIENLLANRQRLVEWLARLDSASSRAPDVVRAKVRADYQGRLGQVVAQLSTHRDVIQQTLDGLRAQVNEIDQLRQEETNIRSEAELRHAVGEYTDDEWQLVELESSGKIAGFDHEIDRQGREIHRLEEVISLIQPDRESRPVLDSQPTIQETAAHLSLEPSNSTGGMQGDATPQPRPEAPRFVPRTGHYPKEPLYPRGSGSGGSGQPRSSAAPTPAPASGSSPTPAATTTTAANREDELAFLRSMNVEIMTPSARPTTQPNGAVEAEPRQATPVPKTLKCRDCGSLNRPTDWYCERCGAELAAV